MRYFLKKLLGYFIFTICLMVLTTLTYTCIKDRQRKSEKEQFPHIIVQGLENGNKDIIEEYFEALDRHEYFINTRDKFKRTVLHYAVFHDDYELSNRLLKKGAMVNIYDCNSITPLALASMNNNTKLIDSILEHNGKIDCNYNPLHITPLMYAIEFGKVDAVKYLLSLGAQKRIVNFRGETAAIVASRYNDGAMQEFVPILLGLEELDNAILDELEHDLDKRQVFVEACTCLAYINAKENSQLAEEYCFRILKCFEGEKYFHNVMVPCYELLLRLSVKKGEYQKVVAYSTEIVNTYDVEESFLTSKNLSSFMILDYLERNYSNHSWYLGLNGSWKDALRYSRKSIQRYFDSPDFELSKRHLKKIPASFSIMNHAHALLFNGEFERAKTVYTYNKEKLLKDGRHWNIVVLEDFELLRKNGQSHPKLEEIQRLLKQN
jgi:hypothetical protein